MQFTQHETHFAHIRHYVGGAQRWGGESQPLTHGQSTKLLRSPHGWLVSKARASPYPTAWPYPCSALRPCLSLPWSQRQLSSSWQPGAWACQRPVLRPMARPSAGAGWWPRTWPGHRLGVAGLGLLQPLGVGGLRGCGCGEGVLWTEGAGMVGYPPRMRVHPLPRVASSEAVNLALGSK